jgi:hypothetical protein
VRPRDATQPPPDIPPPRLFRLLCTTPRPLWAIAYRIRGADGVPLSVRGLRWAECAEMYDVPDGPAHISHVAARVVATALCTPAGPAFSCAAEVDRLSEPEVLTLAGDVLDALAVISPMYGRVNADLWKARLYEGAAHPVNLNAAVAMAECCDIAIGFGGSARIARPDRYFGLSVSQLTDGQLMAYRAACSLVDTARGGDG